MKYFYIVLTALTIFTLGGCANKEKSEIEKLQRENGYEIVKEEVVDVPIKTQVILSIVIDEKLAKSKVDLEKSLIELYREQLNRDGFIYHKNPNAVMIYAYLSVEKANAEQGQWIAMLSKMADDLSFKVTFNDYTSKTLKEDQSIKWSLEYTTRKEIWKELINAERSAQKQANDQFPIMNTSTKEIVRKNGEQAERLQTDIEKAIFKKYKIDRKTLDSISLEGLSNDWIIPPYQYN